MPNVYVMLLTPLFRWNNAGIRRITEKLKRYVAQGKFVSVERKRYKEKSLHTHNTHNNNDE